jgi:zinc protease
MSAATQRGLAPVREVLDNGAVIIVKETHTTPAVTVSAAIQAGSIYEGDAELGLANFLSRVIDRGTKDRTPETIAEQLDYRGVSISINATRHTQVINCTCLSEDFDFVLQLIGEIVIEPSIPIDEVEKRRAEIVTAIRQDEDNPAIVATERLFELLYPDGHPYGRPAKGTIESVEAIDRSRLEAFHKARFAPSVVSLVVVGDVTPARAVAAAAKVFGGWNAPVPRRLTLASPPHAPRRREFVAAMMNKSQADIAYGFTTITRADPRYHAFTLMNNALGQYSLGGRLGDSIRERQGMAYYAFSAFDGNVIESPLIIRAGVNPANVDRAVASIDQEISRIAHDGLRTEELADCKRYLIGSMPRMLETNAAIARFLQTAEFFGCGPDYDLRLPTLLDAVTLDEVNAAAGTLSPDQAAVVIAGPYKPASARPAAN